MRLPNGYGGVVKLSGNRRRPYAARITTGWHINDITGKRIQHYQILGYAPTRSEALQILARYNNYPIDGETLKLTFREIYLRWSEEKFPTISHSNIKGYRAAFATCENIANMPFHNLRLNDLQQVIDHSGKNYPTLKKIRVLFNQLYSYAMKHEIVSKDYSGQTVLMLIYNGVRVSELLDLKKENVHLSEQYFDVIDSKTENGIRKVPIADKVLPFYQRWLHDCSDCEYLIHTLDSQHFTYYMYYHNVFQPLMFRLHIDHTPHCCRHTTISLLAEAHVDQTTIKKIVGHSGAMSLTERIYTHLDVPALVEAINQI